MDAWEVKGADGQVVTTLDGLAAVLRTSPEHAADHLLDNGDLIAAAPGTLVDEAKAAARKKPGGGTPPPISNGNFVSWSNGRGKVDLLVTRGSVPGVEGDVEGTSKSPAARVVVWADGKPTKKKIGMSTHKLRRIAPLDGSGKKVTPAQELVAMVTYHSAEHDALGLPEHTRLTAEAFKTAFDRGVDSWPGEGKTLLNREEWAIGRVKHLVKVATGEVTEVKDAGHDLDLLHDDHPLRGEAPVRLTLDDLPPEVKSLVAESRGIVDTSDEE